jgi:hypothetical protein
LKRTRLCPVPLQHCIFSFSHLFSLSSVILKREIQTESALKWSASGIPDRNIC